MGELVPALGHPFGRGQSVSFGIVSRKGAPLEVAAPGFDFIQSDAAVTPGHSGGPRVNGQVVGINSRFARGSRIGSAIPVNLLTALLPQPVGKARSSGAGSGRHRRDHRRGRAQARPQGGAGGRIRNVMAGQPADVVLSVEGPAVGGPRGLQRITSTPVTARAPARMFC